MVNPISEPSMGAPESSLTPTEWATTLQGILRSGATVPQMISIFMSNISSIQTLLSSVSNSAPVMQAISNAQGIFLNAQNMPWWSGSNATEEPLFNAMMELIINGLNDLGSGNKLPFPPIGTMNTVGELHAAMEKTIPQSGITNLTTSTTQNEINTIMNAFSNGIASNLLSYSGPDSMAILAGTGSPGGSGPVCSFLCSAALAESNLQQITSYPLSSDCIQEIEGNVSSMDSVNWDA